MTTLLFINLSRISTYCTSGLTIPTRKLTESNPVKHYKSLKMKRKVVRYNVTKDAYVTVTLFAT